MDKDITIKELQAYIKAKDYNPELKNAYFQKLIEEVGELAVVLRKNRRMEPHGTIKGTIEEELCDVVYYVMCLANVYDIDLETCLRLKEKLNKEKYK
jgi:NTP pyrophosphatase (non-canonical NTP hydrolase)